MLDSGQKMPTCAVVVHKVGDKEIVCGEPAVSLLSLTNDNNQIYAMVLLCEKHDKNFDAGLPMITIGEDGSRIQIQVDNVFEGQGESNDAK
jgi:hypothetical protein